MVAVLPSPDRRNAAPPVCDDVAAMLLRLLSHPNIASKESVIRRYDHEILGGTVVRPLVGRRRDGHADGVVIADPADTHGLAIGIGVNPWFGEVDPFRMAHAVVDEAIRNVVAVGADPDKIALLDNFSWPRQCWMHKSKGGEDTPSTLVAQCTNCNEGLQNAGPPKPDLNILPGHIRRATKDDQKAVLVWLITKFPITK